MYPGFINHTILLNASRSFPAIKNQLLIHCFPVRRYDRCRIVIQQTGFRIQRFFSDDIVNTPILCCYRVPAQIIVSDTTSVIPIDPYHNIYHRLWKY